MQGPHRRRRRALRAEKSNVPQRRSSPALVPASNCSPTPRSADRRGARTQVRAVLSSTHPAPSVAQNTLSKCHTTTNTTHPAQGAHNHRTHGRPDRRSRCPVAAGVRSEHGDNIINKSAALELPRRGYESISAACLLALLAAHGVIGAIGARRGEAT